MPPLPTPFALEDDAAYRRWRERKLARYPRTGEELIVEVADAASPTQGELAQLKNLCRKANVALYASRRPLTKDGVRRLGVALGLRQLDANLCAGPDAISSLHVSAGRLHGEYIPYSNRPLNWHTDGYYNAVPQTVRAWLLHCVHDAAQGGENALLDPEIAYILLRDQDPRFIEALMHPAAMTIPANVSNGKELRAAQSGPVFSVDPARGTLHMRYTARARHVAWRDDHLTAAALGALSTTLASHASYLFRHRLEPNQGIVSNNALHCRSGFADDPGTGPSRLLYRARYYDRVAGTHYDEVYGERGGRARPC